MAIRIESSEYMIRVRVEALRLDRLVDQDGDYAGYDEKTLQVAGAEFTMNSQYVVSSKVPVLEVIKRTVKNRINEALEEVARAIVGNVRRPDSTDQDAGEKGGTDESA